MEEILKEILKEIKKQNEFNKKYYKEWKAQVEQNNKAYKMSRISFDRQFTHVEPKRTIGGLEIFNIK